MFQLPFASCFNIRRFANRFNESYTVRDEFSMKTMREVVFLRFRSDGGSAEPVRTHLSMTLVSDGPAGSTRHVGSSSGTIAQQRVRDVARASKPKRGNGPRVSSGVHRCRISSSLFIVSGPHQSHYKPVRDPPAVAVFSKNR